MEPVLLFSISVVVMAATSSRDTHSTNNNAEFNFTCSNTINYSTEEQTSFIHDTYVFINLTTVLFHLLDCVCFPCLVCSSVHLPQLRCLHVDTSVCHLIHTFHWSLLNAAFADLPSSSIRWYWHDSLSTSNFIIATFSLSMRINSLSPAS